MNEIPTIPDINTVRVMLDKSKALNDNKIIRETLQQLAFFVYRQEEFLEELEYIESSKDISLLKEYYTTDLLKEIIKREGYSSAPKKTERMGNWHSCIVSIGKDNVADICLDEDDLKALFDMD